MIKITQEKGHKFTKKGKIRDSRGDKRGEIHMNFLLIEKLSIHLYIELVYVRTSSHSCEEKKILRGAYLSLAYLLLRRLALG